MPKIEYVWECVKETPPEIKSRLIDDALERGTNVNDAATRILAAHYGVKYEPTSPRKRTDAKVNTYSRTLMLRLPANLARKIKTEWVKADVPARRDVVLGILAAHYGLTYVAPEIRRAPRKRKPIAA